MKCRIALALLLTQTTLLRANLIVGPWTPIFKGIEHAVATNCPPTTVTNNGTVFTDSALQVVHCLKIDLTDPDVRLFTTPRAPGWVAESRETLSLSISNFIRNYKVQVASDANFYSVNPGGSDPTAEGLPSEVHGLLVSTGQVVSPVDSQGRYASLMFTTNKQPIFNLHNSPPGADLTGIYTAVTGYYPVLTNGVNVWALYYSDFKSQYSSSDFSINGFQPRTILGVSQDKRYLFMMTIDGRQPSSNGGGSCGAGQYSNGALDAESAMWMLLFGGWDAISMDGGGSTAMYMADCGGEPLALNHSSLLVGGRERIVGCHFGVYAKPLGGPYFANLLVTPSDTTALITWQTPTPTATTLEYGPTAGYGNSWSNNALVTNHVVTLNGLNPGTTYYYRLGSVTEGSTYTYACSVATTNSASANRVTIFAVTNSWRWTTNNLDGVNWTAPGYADASWSGPGRGLLYCENNPNVTPKNTPLPPNNGLPQTGVPVAPTYYFRTHFNFPTNPAGTTLYFTNYIDDGAVFYLNGVEIQRIRMAAGPTYFSVTDPPQSGPPCSGQGNANDAACPDLFTIAGDLITNLVSGDNVIAVEVHQSVSTSTDITFGSALSYGQPVSTQPMLKFIYEGSTLTLYWNASGFTLQECTELNGSWTNTTVTASPYVLQMPTETRFYQLHK